MRTELDNVTCRCMRHLADHIDLMGLRKLCADLPGRSKLLRLATQSDEITYPNNKSFLRGYHDLNPKP